MAKELYNSLFVIFPTWPDHVEVLPGHGEGSVCGKMIGSGPSSSVGYERLFNQSLKKLPFDEWLNKLMSDMPQAPPYFDKMKKINIEGPKILGSKSPWMTPLSPIEVKSNLDEEFIIIDNRPFLEYVKGHIPGAISIPFNLHRPPWEGSVLTYDKPLIIVSDDLETLKGEVHNLMCIGLDDIRGYLDGGMNAWEKAGLPLETMRVFSSKDLEEKMASKGDQIFLLDVRGKKEFADGHIAGAVNIPLQELNKRYHEIPKDRSIATICEIGYRSTITASFLVYKGFSDVTYVHGVIVSCERANRPLEVVS